MYARALTSPALDGTALATLSPPQVRVGLRELLVRGAPDADFLAVVIWSVVQSSAGMRHHQ